jgi:hypothetical protein
MLVSQKMSVRKTTGKSNVLIFLLYLTHASRYTAEELLMHEDVVSLVSTFGDILSAYAEDLGELDNFVILVRNYMRLIPNVELIYAPSYKQLTSAARRHCLSQARHC